MYICACVCEHTCRHMCIYKYVCIIIYCPKSFHSLSHFKLLTTLGGRHNRNHAQFKDKETGSWEILLTSPRGSFLQDLELQCKSPCNQSNILCTVTICLWNIKNPKSSLFVFWWIFIVQLNFPAWRHNLGFILFILKSWWA